MPALNIQIDVPNLGTYEIEELKRKLTTYAQHLIAASNSTKVPALPDHQSVYGEGKYSTRINRLRRLCGREISDKDIQEDERLAYLLSK